MLKYNENVKLEDMDEYDLYIEKALLESEKCNKYYTFEELDEKVRRVLNGSI